MTMLVRIEGNKLVIIKKPNFFFFFFFFDLLKTVDNNLKYEVGSIIKHNEFLAKHTIRNKI